MGEDQVWGKMAEAAEKLATLTLNRFATERLREAATLLSHQQDNPYRVAAYRRAADAVAALDRDLHHIMDAGGVEALEQIPGVGRSIATALAEMIRTGRWVYLERLRGSAEPGDVFCAIPGIGFCVVWGKSATSGAAFVINLTREDLPVFGGPMITVCAGPSFSMS
jgi:hypothetical protein